MSHGTQHPPPPQVEREVVVDASPRQVWERLVDGDLCEEWLGVRVEPRPGGRVTDADRPTIGTVEEVDPGRSIVWSWRQPEGEPSQVHITLEPVQGGTRVAVVERLLEYRITGAPPIYYSAA